MRKGVLMKKGKVIGIQVHKYMLMAKYVGPNLSDTVRSVLRSSANCPFSNFLAAKDKPGSPFVHWL